MKQNFLNLYNKMADYYYENMIESFSIICALVHIGFFLLFFKLGILPLVIVNSISVLLYISLLFLSSKGDQFRLFVIQYELTIYAFIATILLGFESGFFLYCLNTAASSLMMLGRSKNRAIYSSISICSLFISVPCEMVLSQAFEHYHSLMLPYNYSMFRFNFLICVLTTVTYTFVYTRRSEDLNSKLKYRSEHDILTDTYNRVFFSTHLAKRIDLSKTDSIIMLDIDDFKNVNDTFGHDVGDLAIKHVANVIKNAISRDDFVVRWGGEEFVVLLSGYNLDMAKSKAEEIRSAIETTPYTEDKFITITLGVTQAKEEPNYNRALKRADDNLYEGKTSGKNKVIAK